MALKSFIHYTSAVAHEKKGPGSLISLFLSVNIPQREIWQSSTATKLLTAFKIITIFPALIWSQKLTTCEFSVQPVTGVICSLFSQSCDSWPRILWAIHLSALPPHVLDSARTRADRQNNRGRQISNRKPHARAEKVFHYFQKDCHGLSQDAHDPCFIPLPFSLIFLLSFHK